MDQERNPIQLECTGARLGRLCLPPFHLATGDFLCLHIPEGGVSEGYRLPKYLTGELPIDGVQVHNRGLYAERPLPQRRWFGFLHNPSIQVWLESRGLSKDQANLLCQTYHIAPNTKIGLLAWTIRSLLGLETVLRQQASLIVFDTHGLDLNGMELMYALVEPRREERAFVHISFSANSEQLCFSQEQYIPVVLEKHENRTVFP